MAKKCSSCGFADNPDNAHYCGKCGKSMGGYEWWRLYNARDYATVEHSKLAEYKQYEQEAQYSIWKKMWKSVQGFWTDLEIPEWLLSLLITVILGGFFYGLFYGIGYIARYVFNIQF